MGTKDNPGTFDCYEKAEPDEPMFILLARDPDAPELVELWAEMRQNREDPNDDDQIREAKECATAMRLWRQNH